MKSFPLLLSLLFLIATVPLRAQHRDPQLHNTTQQDDVPDEDDLESGRSTQHPLISARAPRIVPTEGMIHATEGLLDAWYVKEYMRINPSLPDGPNPAVTPEVYTDRLRRLPTVIEMPYNEVVREYIEQYTGTLRSSVSFMLGAQNFYIPIFEEALEAEGLPLELKYLPIVESALDPTAVSRVGATGLWQFMTPTAKRFNLTINSLLDERRDPLKSSTAAAQYLKELHDEFDDWALALAAYNCGPKMVRKAITRAGGERDYWKIYPYLPNETRGYVPAFIAANYVMHYYCQHNIPPMTIIQPAETDTVTITRDLSLHQVSALCNVSMEALVAMNPQYRTDLIPGYSQPCALRLPERAISYFIELGDSVYNYEAERYLTRRTQVEVPETARPLSRRERAAARAEAQAEAQTTAETPVDTPTTAPDRKSSKHDKRRSKKEEREARRSKKHKKERTSRQVSVRSGDTLEEIAKKHGTTVAKLRKANKIKGDRIKPGEKLRLK